MKDSFGMIDKFCRHAFEIEDGYGCPDANPRNFKVFRDGFFAGYHMGPGVLQVTDEDVERAILAYADRFRTASKPIFGDSKLGMRAALESFATQPTRGTK